MSTTAQEIALMKRDIEDLSEKVDKMDGKIDNLTKILLNPEEGFVVRVNKNTEFREDMLPLLEEIKAMQRWRRGVNWTIRAVVIALIGALAKIFLK
jgi:molecular chaperone GrpE (heat shock protein)